MTAHDLADRIAALPPVPDTDPGPAAIRERADARRTTHRTRQRRLALAAAAVVALIGGAVAVGVRSDDGTPEPRIQTGPSPTTSTPSTSTTTPDVEAVDETGIAATATPMAAGPPGVRWVVVGPNLLRSGEGVTERSTDAGRTWRPVDLPGAEPTDRPSTDVILTAETFVFVVRSTWPDPTRNDVISRAWVSHDDGATFERSTLEAGAWTSPLIGPVLVDQPWTAIHEIDGRALVIGPGTDIHGDFVPGDGTRHPRASPTRTTRSPPAGRASTTGGPGP